MNQLELIELLFILMILWLFCSWKFPNHVKKFIGNKGIITNIHRTQKYDLTMCGYFSIGFTDFMLRG